MRQILLYGFLGFVAVGSFSGCGFTRTFRGECCKTCGRCESGAAVSVPSRPTKYEVMPPATSSAGAKPMPSRVGDTVITKSPVQEVVIPNESIALPSAGSPSLPQLPGVKALPSAPTASKHIQIPAVEKVEAPMPIEPKNLPIPAVEKIDLPIEIPAPLPDAAKPVSEAPNLIIPEIAPPMPEEKIESKEKVVLPPEAKVQPDLSEKYKTLSGQVQEFRKTWRLRYAAVDQKDPYGGVVVLEGGTELISLRDGQQVRVSGVLIPPADRASPARYRVQTVQILD